MYKQLADKIFMLEDPYRARILRCHCIYVDDERKVLIDSSSGPEIVDAIGSRGVDLLLTSHFHEDHILNHDAFPGAEIWAHGLDVPGVTTRDGFIELYGFLKFNERELGQEYIKMLNIKGYPVKSEFTDGQVFEAGKTSIQVVHLPGHTAGHCGFYFPKQNILYSADVDLTDLGPWYGGLTCNVDDFIASIKRIKEIGPSTIVSAHLGIVKERISEQLDKYLDHIYVKEERLLKALKTPQTLDDMVRDHLFYLKPAKSLNALYDFFEKSWISVHLDRLERLGLVKKEEEMYYSA